MKVYLASSWRNDQQPIVLAALCAAGHSVYDFHHPVPGNAGFGWKQCVDEPPPWSAAKTIEALNMPIANRGFEYDFDAMKWCDALVMLQPCGRSAALELGWAAGAGKLTIALLADGQEPELMLKMADYLCSSTEEVLAVLTRESAKPAITPLLRELLTRDPHFTGRGCIDCEPNRVTYVRHNDTCVWARLRAAL